MSESLSLKLRVLRAERRLTLRQVEAETSVSKESLSAIERGVQNPTDITLSKLARFYEVPLEKLLEERG